MSISRLIYARAEKAGVTSLKIAALESSVSGYFLEMGSLQWDLEKVYQARRRKRGERND